jgi:hypothetical protein
VAPRCFTARNSIVIIAADAWRLPLVVEVLGACVLQCERPLRHGHYLLLPSEPNDDFVSYHAKSQRKLSRECGPPALLKGEGVFLLDSQCGCRTKRKVNVLLRVNL